MTIFCSSSLFYNDSFQMILLTLIFALMIDRIIGEPKRFHPLILFGNIAQFIEQKLTLAEIIYLQPHLNIKNMDLLQREMYQKNIKSE